MIVLIRTTFVFLQIFKQMDCYINIFYLPTSLELPWMCGRMHFRFWSLSRKPMGGIILILHTSPRRCRSVCLTYIFHHT